MPFSFYRSHRPRPTPDPVRPTIKLDTPPLSPKPLPTVLSSETISIVELDHSAPPIRRRKSIFKMTDPTTPPNKLRKKQVTFTPSTGNSDILLTPFDEAETPYASYFPEYEPIFGAPDSPTPAVEGKIKNKSSLLSKLRLTNPDAEENDPPTPTPIRQDYSVDDWRSYSYFPEYTPIYPPTSTISQARAYPLTPAEIQAQQQSATLGHAVAVHYPDLPRFAEYNSMGSGAANKGKPGWVSGNHGVEGWTGYGWEGEKLPNAEGQTFGAPMPKGVLPSEPGESKKEAQEEQAPTEIEGGEKEGEVVAAVGETEPTGEGDGEAAEGGGKKNKKKK